MKNFLIIIPLCLLTINSWSQEGRSSLSDVARRLDLLENQGVPLNQSVTIAMNGNIQDLVAFLAESTSLNIAIDPAISEQVAVSFTNVEASNIILYLCDTYNLNIRPTGNIIYLVPRPAPAVVTPPLNIQGSFNPTSGLLQLEAQQEPLSEVAKRISSLTGRNVTTSTEARDVPITTFVNNLPLDAAISQIAASNNLEIEQNPNFYLFKTQAESNFLPTPSNGQNSGAALSVNKVGSDKVSIRAENVNLLSIIKAAGDVLELDYVFLAGVQIPIAQQGRNTQNIQGEIVSIQIQEATFGQLLEQLCRNSPYYYDTQQGVYLVGKREAEGLRETRIVEMQFRSARGIQDMIPPRMIEGVSIDSLYELNSLILSGSEKNVNEIVAFLKSIDKAVPIVMIELTIVDVQVSQLDDYGVEAGVAPEGKELGGTIIGDGGLDFTFSSGAINDFLGLLGERGIINLGQVSPDFYLTLRALQESGLIDIQSTPRLSTLNSHPALLKIGQKRYFQEQQVNFPGFDRPIPVQALIFREVEANLEIQINPMVSGDEDVTLEIVFEQSEFIGDPGPTAPPPQVSRRFDSMIRVRNGETIVLGGLERDAKSVTRSGIPWLSKIPVIGWLFGRKRKNKQNEKLLIFIKPTVVGG